MGIQKVQFGGSVGFCAEQMVSIIHDNSQMSGEANMRKTFNGGWCTHTHTRGRTLEFHINNNVEW